MYNRYIPQPDGTYRRNRMPDSAPTAPPPRPEQRQPHREERPEPQRQEPQSVTPPQPQRGRCSPRRPCQCQPHKAESGSNVSVSGFLKKLLPKDFDTGDLLIVLLLLLMAGDSCDDQNVALLTMAFYLYM